MERKKSMKIALKLLPVIVFLWMPLAATAQPGASGDHSMHDRYVMKAFLSGNMDDWKGAITKMKQAYEKQPNDTLLLHYALAEYGMTGYLIGNDFKDEGRVHLDNCRSLAEKLLSGNFRKEAYAITAGLYGYEIGLRPFKAPSYGKKSQKNIERSMEISTNNPLAWMEKGNAYYHMPGLFGGSYEKAANYYSKALEQFEDGDIYPLWLKTNTRIWLGKAYAEDGEEEKARKVYLQILEKFPDFDWVKKDLLPEVE